MRGLRALDNGAGIQAQAFGSEPFLSLGLNQFLSCSKETTSSSPPHWLQEYMGCPRTHPTKHPPSLEGTRWANARVLAFVVGSTQEQVPPGLLRKGPVCSGDPGCCT